MTNSVALLITAVVLSATVAALLSAARGQDAEPTVREFEVPNRRGAMLDAVLHVPGVKNGTAVVIAPGQGYHKDLPLIVRSAQRLSDAGFHVLRFDWTYFTAKGRPSDDLSSERQDLDAAIAWVRKFEGVRKVIVAGKSLGSRVALQRAAEKSGDLAGVALLTFPIHDPGAAEKLFVDASELDRTACPLLVVTGDRDPLCDLRTLYGLLAKSKSTIPVVTVPGDHSLNDPDDKKNEARTAEHIETAVDALVLWCRRWSE